MGSKRRPPGTRLSGVETSNLKSSNSRKQVQGDNSGHLKRYFTAEDMNGQ